MTGAPVVEAAGLTRTYTIRRGMLREPAHLQAVGGVSFAVEAGRTLAVVGESGCGKSTLARAVLELLPKTAGTVVWCGRDLDALSLDTVQMFDRDAKAAGYTLATSPATPAEAVPLRKAA